MKVLARITMLAVACAAALGACGRPWEDFVVLADDDPMCTDGLTSCGDGCVDLKADPNHCGACDTECSNDQSCIDGACSVMCGLTDTVVDPWGIAWEKTNRGPGIYEDAAAACQTAGGRLPTATEATRAITSGVVSQVAGANIWTIVPASETQQIVIRFSDAANPALAASAEDKTNDATLYRCACDTPEASPFFGDAECERDQEGSCIDVPSPSDSDVIVHLDARDRVHLPVQSAVWECQFYGGHLPSLTTFLSLAHNGITGSDNALWSADHYGDLETMSAAFSLSTNETSLTARIKSATGKSAFRCIGIANDVATVAAELSSGWRPTTVTHQRGYTLASESSSSAASGWLNAARVCAGRGGHLPTPHELGALTLVGLPASLTAQTMWTTTPLGDDNGQIFSSRFTLPGADDPFDWAAAFSANERGADELFRCVTYPQVPGLTAPTSGCNGSCVPITFTPTEAQSWFDAMDRAPLSYEDAVQACANAGAELASERDLIELMHLSDAVGSGEWLHTATLQDISQNGGIRSTVELRWTDPSAYQGDTPMDWQLSSFFQANDRPFRCMWTNELR